MSGMNREELKKSLEEKVKSILIKLPEGDFKSLTIQILSAPLTLAIMALILGYFLTGWLVSRALPTFPPPTITLIKTIEIPEGSNNSKFIDLSLSPGNELAVLDGTDKKIHYFEKDGKYSKTTQLKTGDSLKIGDLSSFALTPEGEIFATDSNHQQILNFNQSGLIKKNFGKPGILNGDLVLPTSLCFTGGSLLVLDTLLCRIQQYNRAGSYLGKFGRKGEKGSEFQFPVSLATDPSGNIWICDRESKKLQVFDFMLNPLRTISLVGKSHYFSPDRIAFGGNGLSFVLSQSQQTLLCIFQEKVIGIWKCSDLVPDCQKILDLVLEGDTLFFLDGPLKKIYLLKIS